MKSSVKRISEKYSSNQLMKDLYSKKNSYWISLGEKRSMEIFKKAAITIPAYKDFLSQNKVITSKINNWQDFVEQVPVMNKKNYLKRHSLQKMCWNGTLKDTSLVFGSTTGSTGKPFYWPRDKEIDWQSSIMHEMFLHNDPKSRKKTTLVIVGFGMGVWVGGLITYQAFRMLSRRDYPISVITPGTNKKEIFEAIINLRDDFDDIIICGYPPFIKDIVDEGKEYKVEWKKLNLKIVFAAESFSENFRDYIVKKTGVKNLYTDTMNIYGSADLGTMAEETPMSILIRRMATNNDVLYRSIFEDAHRLPTLAQYNPEFINFEMVDGEVFCTAYNVLPVIRYAIGDQGGVLTFNAMEKIFRDNNINLRGEARKLGIEKTISELPFVYIYDRSDLSTKLYGAIIYPEHIKKVILSLKMQKSLTGKFTMLTKHDGNQNQYLEINLELKKNVKESTPLKRKIFTVIIECLMENNAEYNYLCNMMPGRVDPKISLWKYEHPAYFRPGIKQKWVEK